MSENIDPRIAPIFRSRPKHERLMAHLVCSLLASVGPEVLDTAIESFEEHEVDWSERLFLHNGHPKILLDFNGSSVAVMRRDGYSGEQIKAVKQAYKVRGMSFPEGVVPKLAEEDKPPMPPTPPELPADTVQGAAGNQQDGTSDDGSDEPVFAGHKLSELLGKTDKELLAIEGIGKATIEKIREAEAARKPQE